MYQMDWEDLFIGMEIFIRDNLLKAGSKGLEFIKKIMVQYLKDNGETINNMD